MTAYRGEIWLINLNPIKKNNEIGKIRPALVLQNDELNKGNYPTTIILPMSTDLIDDAEPLRYRITKKDQLEHDSDILIANIRAIDNTRFIQKLTQLSNKELVKITDLLDEVLR